MARGDQQESYFTIQESPRAAPCMRACLPLAIPFSQSAVMSILPPCNTHLTLLNTMSTSVLVTAFPSITPHSLHILEKFFPVMSLPLAAVLPYTANLWKASSTAAILLLWRKEVVREGADGHLQLLVTHSCPTHLVSSKSRGTTHRYLSTTAMETAQAVTHSAWDPGRFGAGTGWDLRQGKGGLEV